MKTVLILTTKGNKEYVMSEEEYVLFKLLSYKDAISYLKDLDQYPTDSKQSEQE